MSQGLLFKNELLSKSKLFGGGGKYDVGNTIFLKNTDKAVGYIKYGNYVMQTSTQHGKCLGVDKTYAYFLYNTSYQYVKAYDKITQASPYTTGYSGGGSAALKIFGTNDGYIYILCVSEIRKYKISDGTLIWTCPLTNTTGISGDIRVVGNYLYAVYYISNGGYKTYYIKVSLDTPTTYTKISETQIYSNSTYTPVYITITDDNNFYFITINGGKQYYHYNLSDGIQLENITTTNNITLFDYINNIYYNIDTTTIYCYKKGTNELLWSFTHGYGVTPSIMFVTKNGLFIYYNSHLDKYSLNGNRDYSMPFPWGINLTLNYTDYNYDLDELNSLIASSNGSTSYYAPIQIIDFLKITF